jgi:hypothetical protein
MAINTNTRFLGVDSTKIDLKERKGAINNAKTEYYTAQEIVDAVSGGSSSTQVTGVQKTTITSAEVLTMFTSPVTVLTNSDPTRVKYPINVHVVRKIGTAYTLNTNSFSLLNDANTVMTGNLNPSPLTNTEGYFQSSISVVQNLSSAGATSNATYKLRANGADPTDGTGDLDVYVTYVEFEL